MVGVEAARFTVPNVGGWYAGLARPPLTPPNWLFGPAWTALYVLMAVAAWLVWRRPVDTGRSSVALTFWGCQLAVNALWTPVFFGLRMLAPALAVILVLFAAVALTCAKFWRLDRIAGLLLAPYLLWVGFASYLNAGFWFLNHG
jgi:benzodiazapine receptor